MINNSINYFISVARKHIWNLTIFISAIYAMFYFIVHQRSLLLLIVALGLFLYCRAYAFLLVAIVAVNILPHSIALSGGTQFKIGYLVLLLAACVIVEKRIIEDISRGVPVNKFIILFLLIAAANYFRRPALPEFITGTSSIYYIQFGFLISTLSLLGIYLITPYVLKSIKQIKEVIVILAIFAFIGLIFAYLDRFWNIESPFVAGYGGKVFESDSASGVFVRYGWLGIYAIMLLPAILTFIKNQRIKFLVIACLFLSIMLSGGRTSLLVFLCIILLYTWLSKRRMKNVLIAGTISCLLLVAMIFTPIRNHFPQLYRFSIGFTKKRLAADGPGPGDRLGIWRLSLNMIKENPIFGAGPATEDEILSLREYEPDIFYEAREGSHSTYFNIPAIFGIPAFILYLIGVGGIVKRLLNQYKCPQDKSQHQCNLWLILVLSGILIGNIFEGRATGGSFYFYFILGLADALRIQSNMKRTNFETKMSLIKKNS